MAIFYHSSPSHLVFKCCNSRSLVSLSSDGEASIVPFPVYLTPGLGEYFKYQWGTPEHI